MRDYEALCSRLLDRFEAWGFGDEAERIAILVNDLDWGTRYNYLVTFKKWVEFCKRAGVSPLKFDLMSVKQFLSRYKETSRAGYAFRLKRIFEWNGEAADFKVRAVDNELPMVLSDEEVSRLIGVADMKWRTIYRLTYEAAMREHEVLPLKIKHLRFDDKGGEVFIPSTKSQALWLRLIDSIPLLQSWVNQHPRKDDIEAWVFPGRNAGEPLSYIAFYMAIKRHARKAGIQKRVFPHLLRHSRLAWLKKFGRKKGISDSVICQLFGRWSRKNAHRMLDRYGRIEPEDANEIYLKAYGKSEEEDVFVEQRSKPVDCPRCVVENDASAKYCKRCGMILDEREAQEVMEKDRFMMLFWKEMGDPAKLKKFTEFLENL